MVMEVVEMFMEAQPKGWGYSAGVGDEEALSQFFTVQFQISIGQGANPVYDGSSNAWLNRSLVKWLQVRISPASQGVYSSVDAPRDASDFLKSFGT